MEYLKELSGVHKEVSGNREALSKCTNLDLCT